jgi:NTP pyrophosphatase (non-canonical NTP hydrolase)
MTEGCRCDPLILLAEVREIVAAADRESRDLNRMESECCDRLLDAAEALASVQSRSKAEQRT